MKMPNRINRFLSLVLLLSITCAQAAQPALDQATPPLDAASQIVPQSPEEMNLSPEEIEQINKEVAKALDAMVTQIVAQTGRIEEVLQDLSLCINTGSIGKNNKKTLLNEIKNLRNIINSIKSDAFVRVDEHLVLTLLALNDAIIDHIAVAIKNGLKTIPTFDPATLQTRMASISLDQFETKMVKNEEQLEKLKVASQEIGVSWFNKVFRRISSIFVIAHHKKWDTALFNASLVAAVITHYCTIYTKIGYSAYQHLLEDKYKLDAELSKARTTEERAAVEKRQEKNTYLLRCAIKLEANELNPDTKKIVQGYLNNAGYGDSPYKITNAFRRLVGTQAIVHPNGTILNPHEVGLIGRLDTKISEVFKTFTHAYVPIIAFAYGATWGSDLLGWARKHIDLIFSKLQGGTAAQKAEAELDEGENQEPKYNFDDVVGFDHVKAVLNKVLEYIKDPERFDRAQIPPERGYLFTGLPGTGKSFVAEAFGGEIRKIFKATGRSKDELGFYSFDADFINKKGIGWLINLAKKEAPCVIFIDEIDLLCLQRGSGNNSVLLSEFLSSMSGVLSKESGKQVIMLAATNRPEHLDRALRRRGRFGKIIHFELPTIAERRAFFVKKLSPLLPDINQVNIDKLAEQTEGRTYEELNVMINSTFQNTKIAGQPLTQEHLERALDEEIRNVINRDMHVSEQEQELIAAHQAGHAITRALLKARRELAVVTIKPINAELQDEAANAQYYAPRKQKDIQYGNTFTKCSFDHLEIYTRDEKIKECKILLAGAIAERLILGACGQSYHTNDKQEALDLVKSLVFEGLHPQTMPKEIQLRYFEKTLEQLQQYETEVTTLLEQHKDELLTIAHNLVQFKTLSDREVKDIIEHREKTTPAITTQPA